MLSDGAEPDDPADDAGPVPALVAREPGRYRVISEHGRGGVGRVLRASDGELGRHVALKELIHRTPSAEARFVREAIITARLEHPNIVPVHEAGRWPDGTPYYSMKLVSGRPLKQLIEEAAAPPARLALVERVVAVADAIAYAHDRGVIHRDLKPSNVIVGDYGETIVIDWGLARYVADAEDDQAAAGVGAEGAPVAADLTRPGAVLGTPDYMAPEQALGGEVSERTDVYALGAILRDVLEGRAAGHAASDAPPRDAPGGPTAAGAIEPRPRDASRRMPRPLRSIAKRAMAVSPWDRYASARELGDDLRRFLAGERVEAHGYSQGERVGRWLGSHRKLVHAAAALLVALLAASALSAAREQRLRDEAERARQVADQSRIAADGARAAAESERDRADRQTIALLEQQGRAELSAGHPFRAAPILAEAYRRAPGNLRVRWLVTESLRALDSLTATFASTPAGVDPQEQRGRTYSVSMSDDDDELVTGQHGVLGFWDARSGALRRRVALPFGAVAAQHGGPGQILLYMEVAGGSPAGVVDAATGHELLRVPVGEDADWVSWSRDGRFAASIDHAGRVDVWEAARPPVRRFSFAAAPRPTIYSVAMSADGAWVAARGAAELLLASSSTRAIRHLPVPGDDVQEVAFSPDATSVLATMADRSVRIWDVATGRPRGDLRPLAGKVLRALFTGDGSTIVSADSEAVHLWDASSTVRLASLDLRALPGSMSMATAHRASRLVTAGLHGQVQIWDLPRDRWAHPLPGHRGRVLGRYAAGGARIVTADADEGGRGHLRIWDARGGRLESSRPLAWNPAGHLAVTGDGARVALVGRDGAPRVLNARTGRVDLVLDAGGEPITDLSFSPDGARLAAASGRGRVYLWSTSDGARIGPAIREPDGRPLLAVAFSPDGSRLLTGSHVAPARLWDASTGRLLRELPRSITTVVAYSPDGRRIITAGKSGENVPRIWDAATGAQVTALGGHGQLVQSASFSPDGSLVATSDEDGRTIVWDATTGDELRSIEGRTEAWLPSFGAGPMQTVAWSPDGRRLLSAGPGYVLLWNVELDPRTPAQVEAAVATKSPWRLVDGRLSPRE